MKLNFINIAFFIFAGIFFVIMAPFWKSAIWGVTLAIVFYPLHKRIEAYIQKPTLSSIVTVFIILIVIALPISVAVYITINETEKFVSNIDSIKSAFQVVIYKINKISQLKLFVPWIDKIDDSLFSLLKNAGVLVTKNVGVLFSQTYNVLANFFFSFIITFYLIKDKDRFINYVSPIIDDKVGFEKIVKSIEKSINATVLGGVVTALIQGFVGALGFFIVGLNAFFMWMFLIALFSFVPLVGTAIIWIPAAIYLFIKGNIFGGIFMSIWGVVAIGMVDNYVRPMIIGSKINIHPMLLFFGIIGAIIVFGPIGIIVGPVALSVADALVNVYVEHSKHL